MFKGISYERRRFFPGQRWVTITLRTLHLIGVAGLGGGFLYLALGEEWRGYLSLTLASGLALSAVEAWSHGVAAWLVQLCGLAVVLKVLLLGCMFWFPDVRLPLFVLVIIISSVISHAPARVRHFAIWQRSMSGSP